MCGDFKVTLNPVMSVDHYPLPKPQDLFASLSGGKKFTVLDLAQAYLQLPLDEQTQKLVVVNTHNCTRGCTSSKGYPLVWPVLQPCSKRLWTPSYKASQV